MTTVYGTYGPKLKRLPEWVKRVTDYVYEKLGQRQHFYSGESAFAQERGAEFARRLAQGESLYLLGVGPFGHNTGVALIKVSAKDGIHIIANNEEERFSAEKHSNKFPQHSLAEIRLIMASRNISAQDIFCILGSWDYIRALGFDLKIIFEHAPSSLTLLNPRHDPNFNLSHLVKGLGAPKRISQSLGLETTQPLIGMHHHNNHAYLAYALSPFAREPEPVILTVLDGTGDNGAISLYEVRDGQVICHRQNQSTIDSLGYLYGYISSTQGGWSFLSSEGRYMGAAAWGNASRLTNPYYKRLRQILYFAEEGNIHVNRTMVNWHIKSHTEPYGQPLIDILGAPIAPGDMWNPDSVLSVDDIEHSDITQDRVDKAQALQLVFEDALFHIVDHLIRKTCAHKLVLTGGTALNCIANMHLVQHFNRDYFQRYLGQDQCLKIWVPPIPSDCGVALGAAIQFAMRNGADARNDFASPYLCGLAPSTAQIQRAVIEEQGVEARKIGSLNQADSLTEVARFMASLVCNNAVIGVFQGPAETGPRALGNRSILANPRNPNTLELLNSKVKFREKIRPLAPMVTLEEAHRLFELDEGAKTDAYSAYNYMVLTARARPEARSRVPAVVHVDGTSRLQIVRQSLNPLIHAYLKQMGKQCGVEASVNTSLNVGSPIAQTPAHALQTLKRAKGMDALIMVGASGDIFAVWKTDSDFKRRLAVFEAQALDVMPT
ncbi:carbamoyltransferase C-terminal domain-containing protein [Pseudomonas protegens]|uniref:Carbamoyltransferase n=1 Tax=Pseudomonas protegens TaxID=380021 RepID=A0A9Q6IJV1_9PSED|nr:carbamoyltransferase C-terminal domain-containing protein [Pseudomonas protegens]PYC40098.1 carbamoyltransferase [Pseudomonas protegens]